MKLIGIERRAGVFPERDANGNKTGKNIPFDNIMLHLTCIDPDVIGEKFATSLKVKSDNLNKFTCGVLDGCMSDKEFGDFIGFEVEAIQSFKDGQFIISGIKFR